MRSYNDHLLIDADSLMYKAGCAAETRGYYVQHVETGNIIQEFQYKRDADEFIDDDPELTAEPYKIAGDLGHTLSNLKNGIEAVLDRNPHKVHELFIGGKGNFRKDLYPEYKANRSPSSKPVLLPELRDYIINRYNAQECHGEEADDVVSYIQCQDFDRYQIIGIDKDLRNTPGMHAKYDGSDRLFVEEEVANTNFWLQMLAGDSTDNIPGLPGVGARTAKALLKDVPYEDIPEAVQQEYLHRGFDKEYMLLQGRLLWLRRSPDELWTPECMNAETKE